MGSVKRTLTSRGWSLAGAALAMLMGARVLGVVELAMLAAAAGVAIFVAVVRVRRHKVRLEAQRSLRPLRAEAGAMARADLVLTNPGERTSRVLAVTDSFDGGRRVARFLVPPMARGESTEAAYRLPTNRRGVYSVGPLVASVTDPFGLAETSVTLCENERFIVYPRIEQVLPMPGSANREARMGSRQASQVPVGMDFRGLREYEVGDDLRRVHWRSTARTGELMLRQDEMPWETRSTILLDTRPAAHQAESFERAVEIAASLATAMCVGRRMVRFVTTGGMEIVSTGRDRYPNIMDYLAETKPESQNRFSGVIDSLRRMGGGAPVAAITANISGDDLNALGALRARCNLVMIVNLRPSAYGGSGGGNAPAGVPGAVLVPVSSTIAFRDSWNEAVMTCQRSAAVHS